jgi:hypothetical protein
MTLMLREMLIYVAEALFWLTSGELLVNTLWIFVWVFGGTILMLIPLHIATTPGKNRIKTLPALVFLIGFFPMLVLITSPGIVQMDLMQECRTVQAQVTIEGVTETQTVAQCRVKENFYDTDYGPWRAN